MIRREFIKTSAVVTGSLAFPFPGFSSSDEKIKLAIVGTGWWGTDLLLANFLQMGQFEIIGLCDVHSGSLNNAAEKVMAGGQKKPELFSDYKKMYEMDGLQAVAIATPTHWHALQFIDACEKGLDVFLEKPISYDIREGQAMLQAHQKAGNVVQVDFPRVMSDINNQVKNFFESGEAGKIVQVQANINNPEPFLVEKSIPETIDFETYCGPAPKVPYLCAPNAETPNFRGISEFSRGIMNDWGIHYIHNVREVFGLDMPDTVSATGGRAKNFTQNNPDYLSVEMNFGDLPVYWTHKSWGYASPSPQYDIGVFYYCEKATIFAGDQRWEVFPSGDGEHVAHTENEMPYEQMIIGLMTEFAEGIRKKSNKGISNTLENAQKTTNSVIFGDIAYNTKSELRIDPASLDVTNNDHAQKLLKREYRAPYIHPYI